MGVMMPQNANTVPNAQITRQGKGFPHRLPQITEGLLTRQPSASGTERMDKSTTRHETAELWCT